jgi:hypothetical protein
VEVVFLHQCAELDGIRLGGGAGGERLAEWNVLLNVDPFGQNGDKKLGEFSGSLMTRGCGDVQEIGCTPEWRRLGRAVPH